MPACWLTFGVSRWSAMLQFLAPHAMLEAKNINKTVVFPLRLQISLIVYPVDRYFFYGGTLGRQYAPP